MEKRLDHGLCDQLKAVLYNLIGDINDIHEFAHDLGNRQPAINAHCSEITFIERPSEDQEMVQVLKPGMLVITISAPTVQQADNLMRKLVGIAEAEMEKEFG
jgi:hypothetical protein